MTVSVMQGLARTCFETNLVPCAWQGMLTWCRSTQMQAQDNTRPNFAGFLKDKLPHIGAQATVLQQNTLKATNRPRNNMVFRHESAV